jgi:hypothetical protein
MKASSILVARALLGATGTAQADTYTYHVDFAGITGTIQTEAPRAASSDITART